MDKIQEAQQPVSAEEIEIDLSDDGSERVQIEAPSNDQMENPNPVQIEQMDNTSSPVKTAARPSIAYRSSETKFKKDERDDNQDGDAFQGAGATYGLSDEQAKNNDQINSDVPGTQSAQFEKLFFFRPFCVNLRYLIQILGALAALVNQVLDIAYAYRTTYHLRSLYTFTVLSLSIRFVMTLLMGQYFYHKHVRMYRPSGLGTMQEEKVVQNLEDDEEGEEVEQTETGKKMSRRDAEMKDNGQSLYSALHLLYYTGFYRILPSYDFKYELLVGYAIEILISLIPMFFCQIFNNSATKVGGLTPIQSAALFFKLVSFMLLILELILMIIEIRKANEMWKLGIGMKKLSEEERRSKYGKKMAIVSMVAMFAFMILLIASVASVKPEERRTPENVLAVCDERQALEGAVCVDCVDRSCNVCAEDSTVCDECDPEYIIGASDGCVQCKENCAVCEDVTEVCKECKYGYIFNSLNECVKCDDKSYLECEECIALDDLATQTECTTCGTNHRLEDGACIVCDTDISCNKCTEEICIECIGGTLLDSGQCLPCIDTLKHCDACSVPDACDSCNGNIAALDYSTNKCTECQGGWQRVWGDDQKNCECKSDDQWGAQFVNVNDNYKCQTCSELIPGCQKCEQVPSVYDQFYVEIGHDQVMSSSSGNYVICTQGGDNMIQDKQTGSFSHCQDLIPGCGQDKCNADGSSCDSCMDRYYQSNNGNQGWDCVSCDVWSQDYNACHLCNERDGCTACIDGYYLSFSTCWKDVISFDWF